MPRFSSIVSLPRASIFPMASLVILLVGEIACFVGQCSNRNVLTFISGILFVIGGQLENVILVFYRSCFMKYGVVLLYYINMEIEFLQLSNLKSLVVFTSRDVVPIRSAKVARLDGFSAFHCYKAAVLSTQPLNCHQRHWQRLSL